MKEITDMVTLRAFALKQAVGSDVLAKDIVATAQEFADFIKGDAELPEYDDPNIGQKTLVEIYKTMQVEKEKSDRELDESMKRLIENLQENVKENRKENE